MPILLVIFLYNHSEQREHELYLHSRLSSPTVAAPCSVEKPASNLVLSLPYISDGFHLLLFCSIYLFFSCVNLCRLCLFLIHKKIDKSIIHLCFRPWQETNSVWKGDKLPLRRSKGGKLPSRRSFQFVFIPPAFLFILLLWLFRKQIEEHKKRKIEEKVCMYFTSLRVTY